MMQGRHLRGSPLCLPVSSESVIKDRLAMMGLAPLDSKVFGIGTKCFAKWSEDSTWYNAVVEKIVDTKYHVTFSDYGNGDQLEEKDLRLAVKDIPPNEEIDENVPPLSSTETVKDKACQDVEVVADKQKTFTIGENVRAKWSEDDTWYNAKVLSVSGSKIGVNFVDYGNDAEESTERILSIGSPIPDGDMIDELVKETSSSPEKNQEPDIVQPSISKTMETDQPVLTKIPSNRETFSIGESVLAKWSEDETWYNAKVLSVSGTNIGVNFVDYGNDAEESVGRILPIGSPIPGGDLIDELVKETVTTLDKNQKSEIVQPSISKPLESDQPPLAKIPSNEPR